MIFYVAAAGLFIANIVSVVRGNDIRFSVFAGIVSLTSVDQTTASRSLVLQSGIGCSAAVQMDQAA